MLTTLREHARLPSFRIVALIVVAAATVGILALLFQRRVLAWTHVEEKTLTLLRSERLLFLVTDRLVTQIVVSSHDSNLLLGQREGHLIATVRLYYGVDLTRLTPANLHRQGERVVVKVPEPQVLDFAVDPDSLRFLSKRNLTVAIVDRLQGRDLEAELRSRLKAEALAFMARQQLLPTRSSIVARLNEWAPALSGVVGAEVRFE